MLPNVEDRTLTVRPLRTANIAQVATVVQQVYSIRRISLKTETLHVGTFQCVITAMETSGELL